MNTQLATVIYILGIAVLFWLDRDVDVKTSKALWISVAWLFICSSRPLSLWLAIFGIGTVTPTSTTAQQYVEGSPIDRLAFVVLLLLGVAVLIRRWNRVGPLLGKNLPVVLFFSYCLLSVLWSDYPFVTFKHWAKGMGDVVMVLIVLTDFRPEPALKRFLMRVGIAVIPLSVLFIKYYPSLGRDYNIWTWTPMYSGVTESKNGLGMICLIFGLGFVWRFFEARRGSIGWERTRHILAYSILISAVCWLFWKANSVTALACFLLASCLMALIELTKTARKPVVAQLLLACMIAVPLIAVFFDSSGLLVQSMARDVTLTGRIQIWHVVLGLSGNRLVGTGYESFWLGDRLQKVWTAFMPGLQEAHNGYLEIFLTLGWIGVGLLAVIIISGYRNIIAAFRHNRDRGYLRLAFFLVGVVYSLSEAGFRMMDPVWILFLAATIAVPERVSQEVPSELELATPSPFALLRDVRTLPATYSSLNEKKRTAGSQSVGSQPLSRSG